MFEAYPHGIIANFHNMDEQTRRIFPTSFVDRMRIPRAMEVKMAETVNNMSSTFIHPYSAPLPQTSMCHSPGTCPKSDQQLLSVPDTIMRSPSVERKIPSRQSSFRHQEIMDEKERAERINKEKMLVYELREKLRRQGKFEEE